MDELEHQGRPNEESGIVITAAFIDRLDEGERMRNGWPTKDFLGRHISRHHIGYKITVDQLMTKYSPEEWPGYYDLSVCPVCHGQVPGPCGRCGGTGIVCPACRNLKFIHPLSGWWHHDGRQYSIKPCEQCDRLRNEVAAGWAAAWAGGGLTDEEMSHTFENGIWCDPRWDSVRGIDDLRKIAAFLKRWAIDPEMTGRRWVIMLDDGSGNIGVGKSYLCTSIIHEALKWNHPAFKWTCDMLFAVLRERQSPRSDISYAGWLNSLKNFPGIMILDEFSLERITPLAAEALRGILTHRGGRRWLPTVIAGDALLGDVRREMPWLSSRFTDRSHTIVLDLSTLPDWRLLMGMRGEEDDPDIEALQTRPVPDEL
jgi:hypothetical protein